MNRRVPLPPWHPLAVTWATVFLLPLAGATVTAVNLLRMGRPAKALFALGTGLGSVALILAAWAQGIGWRDRMLAAVIVISLGDIGLFLYLQAPDYAAWRRAHPADDIAGPWGAAVWALLGFALMTLIWGGWAAVLGFLFTR